MKKLKLPIVGEVEYEQNNEELIYFEPHRYWFGVNDILIKNYNIRHFIIRMYNICEKEIQKVEYACENIVSILEKSSLMLENDVENLKKELELIKEYEIYKYETVFSDFAINHAIDSLKLETFAIYTNSKNSFIEIDYCLGDEFDAVLVVNVDDKLEEFGYYFENG